MSKQIICRKDSVLFSSQHCKTTKSCRKIAKSDFSAALGEEKPGNGCELPGNGYGLPGKAVPAGKCSALFQKCSALFRKRSALFQKRSALSGGKGVVLARMRVRAPTAREEIKK